MYTETYFEVNFEGQQIQETQKTSNHFLTQFIIIKAYSKMFITSGLFYFHNVFFIRDREVLILCIPQRLLCFHLYLMNIYDGRDGTVRVYSTPVNPLHMYDTNF